MTGMDRRRSLKSSSGFLMSSPTRVGWEVRWSSRARVVQVDDVVRTVDGPPSSQHRCRRSVGACPAWRCEAARSAHGVRAAPLRLAAGRAAGVAGSAHRPAWWSGHDLPLPARKPLQAHWPPRCGRGAGRLGRMARCGSPRGALEEFIAVLRSDRASGVDHRRDEPGRPAARHRVCPPRRDCVCDVRRAQRRRPRVCQR